MLTAIEESPIRKLSKGERTKRIILASAIVILSKHGTKGATHRAIASHASIQLSLTTYYFKDIQELIYQAFELNSHELIAQVDSRWQPILTLLRQYNKSQLKRVSLRTQLRDQLTALITTLIIDNSVLFSKQLIVEQQLFCDVNVTAKLQAITYLHRQAILKPMITLCSFFTDDNPEANTEILFSLFKQQEYGLISAHSHEKVAVNVHTIMHRGLSAIMQIKA